MRCPAPPCAGMPAVRIPILCRTAATKHLDALGCSGDRSAVGTMAGSHKASRGGPFILVTDTGLQDHEPELHHSRGRNHEALDRRRRIRAWQTNTPPVFNQNRQMRQVHPASAREEVLLARSGSAPATVSRSGPGGPW